jgi:hypothetical protein
MGAVRRDFLRADYSESSVNAFEAGTHLIASLSYAR